MKRKVKSAPKRKAYLPIVLLLLLVLPFIIAQKQTQKAIYGQVTTVTPTFFCAGPNSCITNQPTPSLSGGPVISQAIPSQANTLPSTAIPSQTIPSQSLSQTPCPVSQSITAVTRSVTRSRHHHKGGNSGGNNGSSSGLMQQLLQMLEKLLQLLQQLISGSGAQPSNPSPQPNPSTSPTNPCPTASGAPNQPSTAVPSIPVSSPAISQTAPSAGTTTTSPTSGATNPSGSTAPAETSQYKKLIFDDEFNGTSIDTSNWSLYSGAGNAGVGTRNPSADTVSNGQLLITGTGMVSGGMSLNKSQTNGLFEIRASMDKGNGYGPALQLWPQGNGNNNSIDISEIPKGDRASSDFTIHYSGGQIGTSSTADFSQMHIFGLEWTPTKITYFLDGKAQYSTTNTAAIPTTSLGITLQNDIGNGSYISAPDSTTPAHVSLRVDYVRIYQ